MNSRQPLRLLARSRGYAPEPTAPATFTAETGAVSAGSRTTNSAPPSRLFWQVIWPL